MIRKFARPYARAFMDVAQTPQNAQTLLSELRSYDKARRSSSELSDLMANPGIPLDNKLAIAAQISSRLGLSPIASKMIEVLVRNNRINQLTAVTEAWRELINTALGVAVAQVRSAHTLDAAEQERLRKSLEAKVGKRVDLELATDPSLLAGFVAQIGSSVYDASALGRVQRLESETT